jgi:hypothetical protein
MPGYCPDKAHCNTMGDLVNLYICCVFLPMLPSQSFQTQCPFRGGGERCKHRNSNRTIDFADTVDYRHWSHRVTANAVYSADKALTHCKKKKKTTTTDSKHVLSCFMRPFRLSNVDCSSLRCYVNGGTILGTLTKLTYLFVHSCALFNTKHQILSVNIAHCQRSNLK